MEQRLESKFHELTQKLAGTDKNIDKTANSILHAVDQKFQKEFERKLLSL